MLDDLILAAGRLAPGLILAACVGAAYWATCRVQDRRQARRTTRAEARRVAHQAALECQAAADLKACHLIWGLAPVDPATAAELDAELDRRIRDARKEDQ